MGHWWGSTRQSFPTAYNTRQQTPTRQPSGAVRAMMAPGTIRRSLLVTGSSIVFAVEPHRRFHPGRPDALGLGILGNRCPNQSPCGDGTSSANRPTRSGAWSRR